MTKETIINQASKEAKDLIQKNKDLIRKNKDLIRKNKESLNQCSELCAMIEKAIFEERPLTAKELLSIERCYEEVKSFMNEFTELDKEFAERDKEFAELEKYLQEAER